IYIYGIFSVCIINMSWIWFSILNHKCYSWRSFLFQSITFYLTSYLLTYYLVNKISVILDFLPTLTLCPIRELPLLLNGFKILFLTTHGLCAFSNSVLFHLFLCYHSLLYSFFILLLYPYFSIQFIS